MQLPVPKAVEKMFDRDFWTHVLPLHIEEEKGDYMNTERSNKNIQSTDTIQEIHDPLLKEGYVLHYPEWSTPPQKIADCIAQLDSLSFAPSFVVLFDEVWDLVDNAQQIIIHDQHYAETLCNFDILAWSIDPNKGQSGFTPHRDRQPRDPSSTFNTEGAAKYVTCWIALTEATPENSCLYVIPKFADPGYLLGDDGCSDKEDPMRRALSDKTSYQHVRALPLRPGGAAIFTHRILHWGSQGSAGRHVSPRVSLAIAFSDPSYEKPYFLNIKRARPPFSLRVALVCAQMIVYYQRFNFSCRELLLFKKCFESQIRHFEESYRKKVFSEYSKAIIELGSSQLNEEHLHDREDNLQGNSHVEAQLRVKGRKIDSGDHDSQKRQKKNFCLEVVGMEEKGSMINESNESSDEEDSGFDWNNMRSAYDEDEDEDAVEEALDCLIDLDRQKRQKKSNSNRALNESDDSEDDEFVMLEDDYEG